MLIHLQKKKMVLIKTYKEGHLWWCTPGAEQAGSCRYEVSLVYIVSQTSYMVRPNIS